MAGVSLRGVKGYNELQVLCVEYHVVIVAKWDIKERLYFLKVSVDG